MESLEGRSYGPYPLRVCAEKVAEFVDATRDDAGRWRQHAPPGWAAVCLFTVAPHLLESPEIAGRGVVHGEQKFTWHRPFDVEDTITVTGTVGSVRSRGGVDFVGFEMSVTAGGEEVADGSATFLVSGDAPAAGDSEEEDEPSPGVAELNDPPPASGEMGPMRRSASRADLIRYAAASRDWNPIHWDHATARRAGLPGVVAHGLLQAAWLISLGASLRPGPVPLAEAAVRFRAPLRPAMSCTVEGRLDGDSFLARSSVGESELVVARMSLR